jgi:hypothetical protein
VEFDKLVRSSLLSCRTDVLHRPTLSTFHISEVASIGTPITGFSMIKSPQSNGREKMAKPIPSEKEDKQLATTTAPTATEEKIETIEGRIEATPSATKQATRLKAKAIKVSRLRIKSALRNRRWVS